MKNFNSFLILISVLIFQNLFSQNEKLPFQFGFGATYTGNFLNKDIFPIQNINYVPQYHLNIQKRISEKFSLGVEGQYRFFTPEQLFTKNYGNILPQNITTFKNFNQQQIFNGLLNVKFSKQSSSGRNLFRFGLGAGVQMIDFKKNAISFNNPYRFGNLDDVISINEQKKIAPLGQVTIQDTYFITKNLGVTFTLGTQYTPLTYEISYMKIPNSTTFSFEDFCKTTSIISNVSDPFTFFGGVGVDINIGRDNKQQKECFTLVWENREKSECIKEEFLKFKIIDGKNKHTVYRIYLAQHENLDDPILIDEISGTSRNFNINATSLKNNERYAVIVHRYNVIDRKIECIDEVNNLKRCEDSCENAGSLPMKLKN